MKASPLAVEQSDPRTCEIVSGVRSSNCATPRRPHNLSPTLWRGTILCCFSRSRRLSRRNWPVGAPEAVLGRVWGVGIPPGRTYDCCYQCRHA
eukprot:3599887-Alexandrium_andersonii.AAC.1